jgi:predicted nucleic acid-binding protein
MVKKVFDTNILIDYLKGIEQARQEIENEGQKLISIISYIEVLVGACDVSETSALRVFLDRFQVVPVTQEIADLAIEARTTYKLKIPDAIVLATAQESGGILLTRNTKDFKAEMPGVTIPYQL